MDRLKNTEILRSVKTFKKECPYARNRKMIQPNDDLNEDWDPFVGLKSERMGHCICYGVCSEKVEHECCSNPYGFTLFFNLGCLDSHIDNGVSMALLSHTDKGVYFISDSGITKYFPDKDYEIPLSTVDELIDSIYSDLRNGQNEL